MTSVTLYTPYWAEQGGGEKYLLSMAEALAADSGYRVSLLSGAGALDRNALERYFSVSLDRVELHQVPARQIRTTLGGADIAVVMTNYRSMGLPAARTVYVLQVPYPAITAGTVVRAAFRHAPREGVKDLLRRRLLATCRKASAVFVYSDFVRSALAEHHHLTTTVLHPPIDDFAGTIPKEQAILSVGRIFHGAYNDKRYDVLIDAFSALCRQHKSRWEYWIAGSCADDPASQAWLAALKKRAEGYPVYFSVNAPYTVLATLYGRASLFWHAAGYAVDERLHPERTEHFGMSPLEAMSARCVPLVVNAGGTRETVEDGVSGFHWSTTDELLNRTGRLIENPSLLAPLGEGARRRFAQFSRQSFAGTVIARFRDLESQTAQSPNTTTVSFA
jgi:glycosyltransferase involved in cell wall biosynthesis